MDYPFEFRILRNVRLIVGRDWGVWRGRVLLLRVGQSNRVHLFILGQWVGVSGPVHGSLFPRLLDHPVVLISWLSRMRALGVAGVIWIRWTVGVGARLGIFGIECWIGWVFVVNCHEHTPYDGGALRVAHAVCRGCRSEGLIHGGLQTTSLLAWFNAFLPVQTAVLCHKAVV